MFNALQQLIICGDALMIQEDDYAFRTVRQDHYVIRRDIVGEATEIIHLDFVEDDDLDPYGAMGTYSLPGFKTLFTRCLKSEDDGSWQCRTEDEDGNLITEGNYEVSPYIPLRLSAARSPVWVPVEVVAPQPSQRQRFPTRRRTR